MPIEGLSNIRRMPRLGKIRLGVKETSQRTGNEYPKAVDYFVVDPTDGVTSPAAAAAFLKVYGDKPRQITIMFPVDNPDLFFPQFLKKYGAGTGLQCKGDGKRAQVRGKDGGWYDIECNPDTCPAYNSDPPQCRRVGTLQFLLPEVPGLGVWQIDTSSFHSIVNMNSSIDFIQRITGGRIRFIPLTLRIRPQEVAPDGKKKVVFVLDLAHDQLRFADVLQAAQKEPLALLMPDLDEDTPPDDLYAQSVIGRKGDDERPAQGDAPAPKGDAPARGEEPQPTPAAQASQPASDPEPDPLDAQIQQGFDSLGFPPAKRTLWLRKYGQDKKALLAALHAEADQRAVAEEQKAPAATRRPSAPQGQAPGPAAPGPVASGSGGNGHKPQSGQRRFF